ncbi:VOC family protein [Thalassobacillus devorans]|uniref:VOC family protein n=1 Tax=Thalassobacillus devorans TaxID=279813 RepID=UPI000A1CBA4F|nr:VOC family protein [Thalassobacillus devorans]
MLAFDHLVIAADQPEEEQNHFEEKYGIRGFRGGRHETWGTYNYLAHLKNHSYLEWIGIEDKETARKSDNPLIKQLVHSLSVNQKGPIQFALRTNDMDQFLDYWDKEGIPYKGPFPGSRKKTDGTLLQWRMLFPDIQSHSLPFLIEWEGNNRPDDSHLISNTSFTSIEVGLGNFPNTRRLFEKIYHMESPEHENSTHCTWSLENGSLIAKAESDLRVKLEDIIL